MLSRVLLLGWCCFIGAAHAVAAASAGFEVTDIFGRDVTSHGLVLVDWEGQLANPAIQFFIAPPANASFPATATIQANGVRLYFDLPSASAASGPSKTISFASTDSRVPVLISIFPDRDTLDEDYSLAITLNGPTAITTALPVHVIDQDTGEPNLFNVTVDFSRDTTGFFNDPRKRALVQQAADDWAYFIADMELDTVATGDESTYIWNPDGFVSGSYVNNSAPYKGYLLYAYGIHSAAQRSGGEGSFGGGFQSTGGVTLAIKRSGGFEAETAGNYNALGWFLRSGDDDWWTTGNFGNEVNDFYSIAHHEIGHALVFNSAYPLFAQAKARGELNDATVLAYHGSNPKIDASEHFNGELDNASRKGVFGYEYYGEMPRRRWIITKLDLLCAQAIGYRLRPTSAFAPLTIATPSLPSGTVSMDYNARLLATGGVPFYFWEVVDAALPQGLTLDSFTGAIVGKPQNSGTFHFTIRVRDYEASAPGVSTSLSLTIAATQPFQFATEASRLSNGQFLGRLLGPSGKNQTIETSINLLNWAPLVTNNTGIGVFDFVDPDAGNFPWRFYRAARP